MTHNRLLLLTKKINNPDSSVGKTKGSTLDSILTFGIYALDRPTGIINNLEKTNVFSESKFFEQISYGHIVATKTMYTDENIKDMMSRIGFLYSGDNYNIQNGVFASYDIHPSKEKEILSMYFEEQIM